jgi:heavy metal sensor kinase
MRMVALYLSVRAKLTLYFTVLFGAIVIALAAGTYAAVRNDLYSKLNFGLQVAADATVMGAQHEMAEHPDQAGGEDDIRQVLHDNVNVALPDTQLLVKEGLRLVAYRPGGLASADLRRLRLERANQQSAGGLLVVMRELPVPKFHTSYQIYAAKPVAGTLTQVNRMRWRLLVAVPFGLLLAAAAGYLFSRRLLVPLKELNETICGIQSSELSARVRVSNPEDEIGKLASAFNALLDRLEHAFTIQRRFMADASHELRTPVTVALTAAQATSRDGARTLQDSEEALAIIEEQMLRLKRIVTDMLFLSQADASSQMVSLKGMYLDDAVTEATRAARMLARAKGQRLQLRSLPEAACLGDQKLLEQAILVLLENAIKFTQEGGVIEIDLERRGAQWICSVIDSGPGILAEEQSRLFERFFRGTQTGGSKEPGAGLGLAIAKTIVERHGGSLALAASRPGYTSFEILLPAVEQSGQVAEDQAGCLPVKI